MNRMMKFFDKKICFLNINGYYDHLVKFLENCAKEGFINKTYVDMLIVSENIDEIIEKILTYKAPKAKWEK